jgi:peptide/nickel transport system substrate-binding protein
MPRLTRLTKLVGIFAGFAIALSLLGQSSGAGGVARHADDTTLVVGWSGDLNSMDPPDSLVEWNREVVLNTYETLLQYKFDKKPDGSLVWEGLQVAPGLADSWTVEGSSVTFELHKGVKFYPSGNELTADDVKYSWTRMTHVPGFGKFNANLAGLFDGEKQVQVVGRYTVKITFTDANGTAKLFPASLPSLRFPQFAVLDSAVVKSKATADDPWATKFLKDNIVGTGPYYVEGRTAGDQTTLQMIPSYWGRKPAFKRVILRVIKDPADIVALMRRGEVDVTTALGTREVTSLQEVGFKVFHGSVPNIVKMEFALDKPPLDKRDVREALAYAMPYSSVIKNVYGGLAERAFSFVNPGSPGYSSSFKVYGEDLNKAKDLLQRAGAGTGFQVDVFYDSGVSPFEDIALLVQDQLRKLNIVASLKPLPTTQMAAQRTARVKGQGTLEGLILSQGVIWLDDPEPNTDVWVTSEGVSNASRYKNPVVDKLHSDFRFSSDAKARAQAYEKIQGIVAIDVPLLPLVVTGRNAVVHPRITGVSFTADPHNRFWTMYLSK